MRGTQPSLRVEFARQLEFLLCDALDDQPQLIAPFLRGMHAQLDAIEAGQCDARAAELLGRAKTAPTAGAAARPAAGGDGGAADPSARDLWAELHAHRPPGRSSVGAGGQNPDPSGLLWSGLFEYVVAKAAHMLGAEAVRPFVRDLLDPARFEGLARK